MTQSDIDTLRAENERLRELVRRLSDSGQRCCAQFSACSFKRQCDIEFAEAVKVVDAALGELK